MQLSNGMFYGFICIDPVSYKGDIDIPPMQNTSAINKAV
jgi:hypothetical protein